MHQYVSEVPVDDKLNIFYIAGFVASKNKQLSGSPSDEDFKDVSDLLEKMDRGKLTYPSRALYDLALLSYLFFLHTPQKLCRNRFVAIVAGFPALDHIDIFPGKDSLSRLTNVFMKRFSATRNALA